MTQSLDKSPWLRIEGVLLILLGVAALLMPMMAGAAAILVFAWILILSGAIGVISGLAGRAHAHLGWSLASAVIALAVGVVLFINPVAGGFGLMIVVGVYLAVDGVVLIGLSLDHRKRGDQPWGWLLASGLIDLALAAVILAMGAVGSVVTIGVIAGISLVAAGGALLMLHRSGASGA